MRHGTIWLAMDVTMKLNNGNSYRLSNVDVISYADGRQVVMAAWSSVFPQ